MVMFLLAACTPEYKGKYQPDDSDTPGTFSPTVRYRGILVSPSEGTTEADIRRLGSWGVNHVRWVSTWWGMPDDVSMDAYLDKCDEWITQLDALMPVLKEEGITVCLNIHHPPRNRDDNNVMRLFQLQADEADLQGTYIEAWRRLAEHYKDEDNIVFYDLINEPDDSGTPYGLLNNRDLHIQIIDAILAIDNTKKFVFEQKWDEYNGFEPIPRENVIYSAHIYQPGQVTLQMTADASYPGEIDGEYWDKAMIRNDRQYVINFAKTHRAEIYIGEFGCARWAPNHSAYNYLRDCLEIFEAEGWHYTYHFDYPWASGNYGANMWSLQYDETLNSSRPVSEPTDRLELMQTYWAKNGQ